MGDTEPQRAPDPTASSDTQGLAAGPRFGLEGGASFGRYRELELLGSGGMATVFRAYDPSLGRLVALKLLRGHDPALAQRLLLEARAQARVDHEHVCRVHEAGEEGGRPYIAMQYVEGRSLREVYPSLTLEQKLKLMSEVAEGLHAAHRVGLLHRDVKPSNVMVDVTDDGVLFPYVVDFGLALEVDAPGITTTRLVLGTPAYMSPEQAKGDSRTLDRRSDVYSLGATLYEMIAGSPPFASVSSVDVLVRLLAEEPAPLSRRDPKVPRDVETIVMKCLEKDPARRYESARALAQDLRSYLDGEPIGARPSGALELLYRRARKHRAAVATAAVGLLLVTVSALLAVSARASARRQVALAAEFARTVEDVEWIMRVAHMAPLHDTRREKEHVRARLAEIAARVAAAGSVARGPGEYALGRGLLVLGEPQNARRHLEAAWQQGYRTPEVAYALGLAFGALYRAELELADAIGNRELREVRRREVQAAFREPAISYLRQSAGTDVAASEYVEGLLAWYEKRPEAAVSHADAALARVPWLYEANVLKGDVHAAMARQQHETGDAEGSRRSVERAAQAYRSAADYGRSDPGALEGLCQLGIQRMEVSLFARGGDLAPLFTEVRPGCERALLADPERAEVHAKLANIHRFWANHLALSGQDPLAALDLAAGHAQKAIALNPENRRAHGNLGILSRLRAQHAKDHGQDPAPALRQAFASLQKAVELSGGDAASLNDLGNAHLTRALSTVAAGGDPLADLAEAVTLYEKALARVPDFGYAHANRGSAFIDRARHEMDHGMDPTVSLSEGRRSLEHAILLLPQLEGTHTRLADALALAGRFALLKGADPQPALVLAAAQMDEALRLNPRSGPDVSLLAGTLALVEAEAQVARRKSPEAALARATSNFRLAAAADRTLAEPWEGLAEAAVLFARWANSTRQSPEAALARGRRAYAEALRRNQAAYRAHAGLADLQQRAAAWKSARGQSPRAEIENGLIAAARALSLHPRLARALIARGMLVRLQAEASPAGAARIARLRTAEEALRAGIAANPHLEREYGPELARVRALLGG